jgi:hypothetical protein
MLRCGSSKHDVDQSNSFKKLTSGYLRKPFVLEAVEGVEQAEMNHIAR